MDWTRFAALVDEWPATYGDIDCSLLDPADGDDREIGLAAAHPEYHEALETDENIWTEDGVEVNPRLHVLIHRAVAEQLITGSPHVRETAQRLLSEGFDGHDVLHLLGDVFMDHVYRAVVSGEAADAREYMDALEALPDGVEDDDYGELTHFDESFRLAFEPYRDRIEQLLLAEPEPLFEETIADEVDLAEDLDAEDLLLYLHWHADFAHVVPDGRVAHISKAVEGVMALHRLTPDEVATGRLLADDLWLLDLIPHDERTLPLATGGEATWRHREAVDGPVTPPGVYRGVTTLEGPAGWLDAVTDAEVIALSWRNGQLHVEPSAVNDLAAARAAAALAGAFAGREAGNPELSHWDGGVLETRDILLDVLVAEPELLRRPTAPVPELVDRASLSRKGGWVGPADFDWEERSRQYRGATVTRALRDAGTHPEDADEVHGLVERLDRWLAGDEPEPRDMARAADSLMTPGAASAAFDALCRFTAEDRSAEVLELATRILDRAPGAASGGVHFLAALCADDIDDGVTADRHARHALTGGVTDRRLYEMAADCAFVAGELRRAARFLDLAEVEEDEDDLVEVLAPFRVEAGRNDPCACGSGRKFKQCHGQPSGPPLTAQERAERVHQKAVVASERSHERFLTFMAVLRRFGWNIETNPEATPRQVRLAADLVLFEGEALRAVGAGWGALFPEAERRLLDEWIGTPITVTGTTVTRLLPIGEGTWQPWELPLGATEPEQLRVILEEADLVEVAEALAPLLGD